MFVFFVKCDVSDRLVRHEPFLARIVTREIEIRVPRAGVEVDLIADGGGVFERDSFLMMRVTINKITRGLVEERRFEQGVLHERNVAALFSSLQAEREFVNRLEGNEFGKFDTGLQGVHHVELKGFVRLLHKIELEKFFRESIPYFFQFVLAAAPQHILL